MANIDTVKTDTPKSVQASQPSERRCQTPPTDILENDAEYLLLADMPGVEADAVNIQLNANELVIEGSASNLFGSPIAYRRVFQVGPGIDPNGISAELKQGVLHLSAKKSEALKPRDRKSVV